MLESEEQGAKNCSSSYSNLLKKENKKETSYFNCSNASDKWGIHLLFSKKQQSWRAMG